MEKATKIGFSIVIFIGIVVGLFLDAVSLGDYYIVVMLIVIFIQLKK